MAPKLLICEHEILDTYSKYSRSRAGISYVDPQTSNSLKYLKSVGFSLLGGWMFAFCNTITSVYVKEYGIRIIETHWASGFLIFLTYHLVNYFWDIELDSGWKAYTYVDPLGQRKIHRVKLCMPVVRASVMILHSVVVSLSF
jgi:hypothetical protein